MPIIHAVLKAHLLFHLRVGVRVAIRATPALFSGIAAIIVFQDSPSAFVAGLANAAFSSLLPLSSVLPIALIAFLLPAWSRPRLREGTHGWLRHLPISNFSSRCALLLALLSVQLPLVGMLVFLAMAASQPAAAMAVAALRWALVLIVGA